jgi:hypothetical protein
MNKDIIGKSVDPRSDVMALEEILSRYVVTKNRSRYLRLRNVRIQRDEYGGALIEPADLIDAVWDAADFRNLRLKRRAQTPAKNRGPASSFS